MVKTILKGRNNLALAGIVLAGMLVEWTSAASVGVAHAKAGCDGLASGRGNLDDPTRR